MKTITFKELIELIEKNEQPEVIWTSIHKFEWDEITENYFSRDDKGLLVYHTLGELVVEQIQIPTETLLTDEEKAYLKAVIEPFRGQVKYIIKRIKSVWIATENYESVSINTRDLPFKFDNLELYKQYFNLKDLDLE